MKLIVNDVTLRDGNHAVSHSIKLKTVKDYCKQIDKAGLYSVEVGHGNGLGASSLQVGLCKEKDEDLLKTARKNLNNTKLCVHSIPSFATIKRDINKAIDLGVDIFRIGTHCTEADITETHINYLKSKNKEVYGAMMMIHMASTDTLINECNKIESYGADGIVLMDSVGFFTHDQVSNLMSKIKKKINIKLGFHAHNNLGMAISNSIEALNSGADLLDASSNGFGAGAGNAQLEVLIALLNRIDKNYDLRSVVECSNLIRNSFSPKDMPSIDESSLYSGLNGVFSGFKKHVQRISLQYQIPEYLIWSELGKNKVIGGQEDLIFDIALKLKKQMNNV